MRKIILSLFHIVAVSLLVVGCSSHPDVPTSAKGVQQLPAIYPDYCNVTVPCNIAPLNFMLADEAFTECVARVTTLDGKSQTYGEGCKVIIPESDWHDILSASRGKDISVEVWGKKGDEWLAYKKFSISVADDSIDEYISYRLIEPSYLIYEDMEIAQRQMSSFDERTIYNNKVGDGGKGQCINCHSYQNYKTDNMLFHARATNGGTIIVNDGEVSKVDLKRDNTISAGVYPSWHPTEKLVAFSTNTTRQLLHTLNKNKTEVFDLASDLILYDVNTEKVTIVCADTARLEVFPTWSPDGKYLYYCSTLTLPDGFEIKADYQTLHYNLYRRSFDAATRQFGEEELVYDAVATNHSVSLPRVSPDGKYVVFARGSYGCFNIWHHDADIVCIPIADTQQPELDLHLLNSKGYAESYPSFSSNGKWIMCASRRDDGNYSRVYISYFDGKKARKAFLLPQSDPEHNGIRLKSYNRPEFMVEPVKQSIRDFNKVVTGK